MRSGTSLRLAYVAAASLDTYLATRDTTSTRRLRALTKPTLMPLLAASHRARTNNRTDLLNRATLTAQAASWGGDLALLGASPTAFRAGVGSFGVAHLAYVAGFLSRRDPHALLTRAPGACPLLEAWAVATPVMAIAAARHDPRLGAPVAGYTSLLTGTVATSMLLSRGVPVAARAATLAGTTTFLLSDLTLGIREFLLRNPGPTSDGLVMATYATAQLLISEGVIRAGHAS